MSYRWVTGSRSVGIATERSSVESDRRQLAEGGALGPATRPALRSDALIDAVPVGPDQRGLRKSLRQVMRSPSSLLEKPARDEAVENRYHAT
jgi:hypothetical protein